MRVTPTHEQMEYLALIGVSGPMIPQATPVVPGSRQHAGGRVLRRFSGRSAKRWTILVTVLLILLSIAVFARANEIPGTPDQGSAIPAANAATQHNDPILGNRLLAIEKEVASLRMAPKGDQLAIIKEHLRVLDQQIASFAGLSKTAPGNAQGGPVQPSDQKIFPDSESLRRELDQRQNNLQLTLILLVVIAGLSTTVILTGIFFVRRSLRRIEQKAILHLSERFEADDHYQQTQPDNLDAKEIPKEPPMERKIKLHPAQPQSGPLLSPAEQLRAIIESESKFNRSRFIPRVSTDPWGLALATTKGNVRSENQDYGLCFRIAGHQVLLLADGCGGLPFGQRAAYLASVSAAVSIIRTYGMSPRWHAPCVKAAARKAIAAAEHRLAIEGDKLNISEIRGGLRTTLIVVVANRREIGYAYIGDGGGCVVHSSGKVHHFLNPQKADEFALNILAASLGPITEGEPVVGVLKRSAGDLLVVGTDGIFDRVDKGFPKDVLRGCIQFSGDLQKTAEHIIQELASYQDKAGYVCDDNLTLGIMGDEAMPTLSPSFWSSPEAAKKCQPPVQAAEVTPCLKGEVS